MTNEDLKQALELLPSDEARAKVAWEADQRIFGWRWIPIELAIFVVANIPLLLVETWVEREFISSTTRGYGLLLRAASALGLQWFMTIVMLRVQRRHRTRLLSAAFRDFGVSVCAECGYLDRRLPGEPRRCSECGAKLPELPPPEHVTPPPRSSPREAPDR